MKALRRAFWGFWLITALFYFDDGHAESPEDNQQRLEAIEKEINAQRAQAARLAAEAQTQSDSLLELQRQAVLANAQWRAAEQALAAAEASLKNMQARQADMEVSLQSHRRELSRLLPLIVQINRQSAALDALANRSLIDRRRQDLLVGVISRAIGEKINAVRPLLADARALKRALEDEQSLAMQKARMVAATREILDIWMEQRREALGTLNAQQEALTAEIANLSREAEDLKEFLERLQSSAIGGGIPNDPALIPDAIRPFPEKSGISWPVEGEIAARFGEQTGIRPAHEGITFRAKSGASVSAPFDGRVVFAGSFRFYGPVLIIEHRGGYHSVIAGIDRIDLVADQWVLSGEPIGTLQQGGGFAMLYYEIRHNGRAIDPTPWIE